MWEKILLLVTLSDVKKTCSNNLIFIQPLHSIVDAVHVISIVTIATTPLSQFTTLK